MPRLPALVLCFLYAGSATAQALTPIDGAPPSQPVAGDTLWPDLVIYGLPAIIVLLILAGVLMRINRRLSSEIARREVLEQERRTSEHHYRGLVESLSAIAWEANTQDYSYSYVSPHAENLLGYPVAKWREPGFWRSVLHPMDALWAAAFCDAETAAGRDHSLDYRVIAADGRAVWVRDIVSLIDQGGSTIMRGLMIDISETKQTEEALRQSREKFAKAFHASPDGLLLTREVDGRMLEVNEGFSRLTGYQVSALTECSTLELGIWVDLKDRARMIEQLHEHGIVKDFTCLIRRADGEIRLCELSASPMLFSGEACMLIMARDITERHLMQEKLLLAATVFESTAEGVLITDTRQRISAVNRAFTEITGYSEAEALGQTPRLLASGRHDHGFFIDMWHELAAHGHWQGEIYNRRKNGELYPSWLTISSVRNPEEGITHFVAVFADISSLKQAEARLDYQAHHDPLTGLPNRTLFESRLQASLNSHAEEVGQGAVLFLDLDRFKHINDSLGHPVGDLLLKGIANRLREQVRDIDTVARLGGDEFIILLPGLQTSEDAEIIANKVLACFTAPFQAGEHEFFTSASIGASLYPQDGGDVATLVKNADAAMYRSKAKGRNRVESYTRDLTAQASARVALEHELRRAIERNELSLCYQPKFSLKSHRLVGAEALIRWNHPTFGEVPPERFIPLAEENGMILPLGEWVLETACLQMRTWQDRYQLFGPLSVNLAGAQLRQPDLFAQIERLLEDHDLHPGCLQLEITENFIMSQAEEALLVLHQLRGLGVLLAIDDFGTGYSSLSYLKRLPLHTLKIDQSFVRGLPHDQHDAAIVRAIIALGRSMQLTVIAEGVENKDQQEFLAREGCEQIQGYIVSLPLAPGEFAATFLRARVSDFSDGAVGKPSL